MRYYIEKCDNNYLISYPFLDDKIKSVQYISKKIRIKNIQLLKNNNLRKTCEDYIKKCKHDVKIKCFYVLGNIIWPNILRILIKKYSKYPSEYFIKNILNLVIINDYIINPPPIINENNYTNIKFITFHYNKLLIIDALMKQGSYQRYINSDENGNIKYLYSEHSGVINIKNNEIDSIIVSTETNRIDNNDSDIYLPQNIEMFKNHKYLFHTHPNANLYGGRINDGILYELPSVNDLLNYSKYYNNNSVLASIIVSPEGMYVIRSINYNKKISIPNNMIDLINRRIIEIESIAISKLKNKISNFDILHDEDVFNELVGNDFDSIKLFNNYVKQFNIFVEYYPRIKRNNEWCLRQMTLINYL